MVGGCVDVGNLRFRALGVFLKALKGRKHGFDDAVAFGEAGNGNQNVRERSFRGVVCIAVSPEDLGEAVAQSLKGSCGPPAFGLELCVKFGRNSP